MNDEVNKKIVFKENKREVGVWLPDRKDGDDC
jgi:hypothetical protein